MLVLRTAKSKGTDNWHQAKPGKTLSGLFEDTDYVIRLSGALGTRLYIDDVEFMASAIGEFQWRPCFYAGRVMVEVEKFGGGTQHCWLDVGPAPQKSGEAQFEEMVTAIRAFDVKLLGGSSAAVMAFGREGQAGLYSYDILLSRVRAHGAKFLDAVDAISRAPHLSISADNQVLPLARVRKLHPSALRDRRLLALATGNSALVDDLQTIQLHSVTSSPTFDTPANQALLALLKRFRAAILMLREKVEARGLGLPVDDQAPRVERRLGVLNQLEVRASKLICCRPFSETSKAQTTSSGLTQIAAQPIYNRAYRIGSRALVSGIGGVANSDDLHITNSWGIYETWCYLAVIECIKGLVRSNVVVSRPRAVSAELGFSTEIGTSCSLEILFQANFPSLNPSQGCLGHSISRMRIPDIILVERTENSTRTMVFDAKWRSGRENVLDAMQSAHVYHDSLRVDNHAPSPCVLLLPGKTSVPELETTDFISTHGVGVISEFSIGMGGIDRLREVLCSWLAPQMM